MTSSNQTNPTSQPTQPWFLRRWRTDTAQRLPVGQCRPITAASDGWPAGHVTGLGPSRVFPAAPATTRECEQHVSRTRDATYVRKVSRPRETEAPNMETAAAGGKKPAHARLPHQEVLTRESPVATSRPDISSLMCRAVFSFFAFHFHSSAVGGAVATIQRG